MSKTERNFGYEQAQSLRWLRLQFDFTKKKDSEDDLWSTHRELLAYFRSPTLEARDAGPELSARSKAVLDTLAAERERSRMLQGGIANPNDWFIDPIEQSDLVSLMRKSTLSEHRKGKRTPRDKKAGAQEQNQSIPGQRSARQSTLKEDRKEAASKEKRRSVHAQLLGF